MLSIKLFRLVICLFWFNRNIETRCFTIEAKQTRQTVSKQTVTNRNNPTFSEKNTKLCSLSNCFGCSSVCFGSIETLKLSLSVQKRNNRNKRFASDSAAASFGSIVGCFELKLVFEGHPSQNVYISQILPFPLAWRSRSPPGCWVRIWSTRLSYHFSLKHAKISVKLTSSSATQRLN